MQFWTHYIPAGSAYIQRMALGQEQFNNAEFEFLTSVWMELQVSECYIVSTGE
jgi:hypothetical protein